MGRGNIPRNFLSWNTKDPRMDVMADLRA